MATSPGYTKDSLYYTDEDNASLTAEPQIRYITHNYETPGCCEYCLNAHSLTSICFPPFRSSFLERFYLLVWIIAFCIFTSVLAVTLIGTDSSIKGAAKRCDLLCPTDCLKPKRINFGASYHQAFYYMGLESYHFILESDTDHYLSCKNFKDFFQMNPACDNGSINNGTLTVDLHSDPSSAFEKAGLLCVTPSSFGESRQSMAHVLVAIVNLLVLFPFRFLFIKCCLKIEGHWCLNCCIYFHQCIVSGLCCVMIFSTCVGAYYIQNAYDSEMDIGNFALFVTQQTVISLIIGFIIECFPILCRYCLCGCCIEQREVTSHYNFLESPIQSRTDTIIDYEF